MALDNVSFGLYANVSCGEAPDTGTGHDSTCSNISHGGGVFDTYMAGQPPPPHPARYSSTAASSWSPL